MKNVVRGSNILLLLPLVDLMSTANLRLIGLVISWQTVGRTAHLDGLFLGLFHGLFLGLFLI